MARTLAYDPKFALNAICPYFTMFPLEYPYNILKRRKDTSEVIFDPFCGRGTTLYAARLFKFQAWGFDTSPIAVAIAKAKLARSTFEEVLNLAEDLILTSPSEIPATDFFKHAYSKNTLIQICSLREGLYTIKKESGASTILRAILLGSLHGPINRTKEGLSYFSNQMPRTFSSKPDYSVKYWKLRGIIAPDVNVLDVVKRKLARIKDINEDIMSNEQQVMCLNSCAIESYKKLPKNISTVITSPPYYGMRTYVQDQWLRNWFLGGRETIDYSNDNQISHSGVDKFTQDLASVWKNIAKSKAPELHYYIRFGTLPSTQKDAKIILRNSIEEAKGLKVISVRNASDANAGKRQADQMNFNSKPVQEYDFHVVRC